VPLLTCLILLLSTLWANLSLGQSAIEIPLDNPVQAVITARQDIALGTKASDFRLKDVDGRWITLQSLRDRQVLLYFSSDCTTCSLGDMAADLDNLAAQRADIVFAIVAPATRQEMLKLRKELGYKALLIPSKESDIAKKYKVAFEPRLYVMDKAGLIRYVQPESAPIEWTRR
jgi:peroxiredoxin